MDKLEKFLRENAIYSPEEYKEIDTKKLLEGYEVEKKYMGILSRVYFIKGTPWVLKEGRWDVSFELVGDARIPFPARFSEYVLKRFSFTFLPRKKHILEEYGRYLIFAQYFGYFENKDSYYHPNRDLIFSTQKSIRKSLAFFRPEIEKKYHFKLNPKIDDVLNSEISKHNFLPKEYQLIGESISPENKDKLTSLIFQEFVDGKVLRDYSKKDLSKDEKKQLILLIY